ncbi:hypothetical protein [Streptomyces natalensis]|uniref:Uncharacterized protein n=1 Tax=Streptomyces natalensis ATCC 27448 TaxID=1240678 RepID=A0A0D7CM40_9ACTN|nr:hypothetical protein [Streptomyces natalensis]KIZ17274.1 hypothetical protein SNA_14695 [Streptomyces natalensis ATCC 27448]
MRMRTALFAATLAAAALFGGAGIAAADNSIPHGLGSLLGQEQSGPSDQGPSGSDMMGGSGTISQTADSNVDKAPESSGDSGNPGGHGANGGGSDGMGSSGMGSNGM